MNPSRTAQRDYHSLIRHFSYFTRQPIMKSTTIVLALALAAAAAFALPSGDTGSLGLSADADAEVKVPGMIEPFDYLKWLHNSDHEGENNKKNHHHTATSHSKYTTASHSKSTTTSHSKSTTTTSHSKSTAASHSKSSTTAHSKSTVTSHSKSTATSHSRPTATSRSISVHAPVAHPTATHAAIDDAETRVSSNDVAFTWCRTWANSSTCSTASLRHGQCCKSKETPNSVPPNPPSFSLLGAVHPLPFS